MTERTFADVLDVFIERCEAKGLEPASLRSYRYQSESFLRKCLGHLLIDELSIADLETLYTEMSKAGYRPSTIKKTAVCAGAALKLAERNGWVRTNVARLAETPRSVKPDRNVPTPEQLAAFTKLAYARDPDIGDYARVMAGSGIRPGEACALKGTDLDGTGCLTIQRAVDVCEGRARIKSTKTGRVRQIPLDERTAHVICRRSEQSEWVFGNGEPARTDLMSKRWKRVACRAGFTFTPRSCRHFYATSVLASGRVSVRQAAELLGHANTSMTLDVYSQFVPSLAHVAAEVIADVLDPEGDN